MRPHLLAALALLPLTAGCGGVVRSHYAAPAVPVAANWDAGVLGAPQKVGAPWWNEFDDAALTALVDRVLADNADLAAAGLRLKRAKLSSDLARQALLPSLSANASSDASKALEGGSAWSKSSSASLGASWEIDLFGRLDAQADAARWEAQATAQDLAETRLALVSTTVQAWWQLAYANEQIALGEQSLAYVRRALELVQRQYDAGAVSRLELRDAQQTVASQESSQTQLVQARVEALKTIAALLARQDYDGQEPQALPQADLPAVAAGVPASLLANRPDLAAAELRLRSTLATSDATVASYYPSFSLTGALGTASSSLLKFFTNPVASLGGALSLAELNPAKVRLATGVARADYDIAVQDFRQTFYDALRDTQVSLSARDQYIRQAQFAAQNFDAAVDAEALYERQYRAGLIPLRSWLDAQERARSARSSLIQNRYNRLVAQVQVYQALGGQVPSTGS
ncbi:NodT family RND efflux system outer membrane lipoprotein [Sphingomonas sp. LH128]|jgi:NodT family efflux transporter outer membrane factor (OMF) lipoprotein|uniref:NodT family RND efflux system outer membrane lipoprotein n=1 Tax=Novosphingobium resinovorum TaxID=158500 RepID=A0A031JZF5_9SPHN|nr:MULTISPECIES: efflux transporter outer membrane subunit [Sphingomonadaceae]AOR76503.1 transporter [Novosphingobium resinovorum]EJU13098.1 NodT family RND efflux system outer membrane lipoprotein [Sphingomonas sp. LH128]EZP83131.1 NodT family RND efflux system outer membrane lipoprotein [Novosphingobium resinovorum]